MCSGLAFDIAVHRYQKSLIGKSHFFLFVFMAVGKQHYGALQPPAGVG